ncbi:hypothetical protein [Methylorubrum thiocyanatum]|uniref:hypothetical protein n=1 Tax=Methylorubrum thiocyanatum TaxID=47958 RepID=UPI00398C53B6
MPDADARLGEVVAALVRAGRALRHDHLDELLENVAVEIAAALMEEDARRRGGRSPAQSCGKLIPFPVPPNAGCGRVEDDGEFGPDGSPGGPGSGRRRRIP